MPKHIEDDCKGQGQSGWAAVSDIEERAKAAYKAHPEFFDSDAHNQKVTIARALVTDYAKFFDKMFVTDKQSKGQPFTLVKLNKVEFKTGMRVQLNTALELAGYTEGEFGYRQASQSFFVKVK
jgi:hypothetical protein